jgi:transcriptional regulator with XRE-family HTH domain
MKNIVGGRIKEIREAKAMTQEQLAIQLQIIGWQADRFVVSKIERGEREVRDIEVKMLAKALRIPVSELFGGKND